MRQYEAGMLPVCERQLDTDGGSIASPRVDTALPNRQSNLDEK